MWVVARHVWQDDLDATSYFTKKSPLADGAANGRRQQSKYLLRRPKLIMACAMLACAEFKTCESSAS